MSPVKIKQGGKKGGGAGLVIGLTSLVIVAAAAVGIIIFLLVTRNQGSDEARSETAERRNVVVTQENVEGVIQEMENRPPIEEGYYNVKMTGEWHFPKGDAVSLDAFVENVPENSNDVYFDIFLNSEEEEAIYKSPVIPRGASLEGIKLDTPLEAGTYDCLMIYHLIDENQNTLDTLRVTVTLVIEG